MKDKEFNVELYDKRDDFPFKVIGFPHFDGNIPMRIGRNVLTSKTLRIARACAQYKDFLLRTRQLLNKMMTQGLPYLVAQSVLRKLVRQKDKIPYNCKPNDMLKDLLTNNIKV